MFFSGSETNINPYNPFFFYGVELQYCIYQYIDACLGVRAERSKQEECIFHFEQYVCSSCGGNITQNSIQPFFSDTRIRMVLTWFLTLPYFKSKIV